jgi:hypothetical protein
LKVGFGNSWHVLEDPLLPAKKNFRKSRLQLTVASARLRVSQLCDFKDKLAAGHGGQPRPALVLVLGVWAAEGFYDNQMGRSNVNEG